jgi:hypothetical protein
MLNLFNKKQRNIKKNINTYDIIGNKGTIILNSKIIEKSKQLQFKSKIDKTMHYHPATKE